MTMIPDFELIKWLDADTMNARIIGSEQDRIHAWASKTAAAIGDLIFRVGVLGETGYIDVVHGETLVGYDIPDFVRDAVRRMGSRDSDKATIERLEAELADLRAENAELKSERRESHESGAS